MPLPPTLYFAKETYQRRGTDAWQTSILVSHKPDLLTRQSRYSTDWIISHLNELGIAVAFCGAEAMPEGYYHLRLYFMEGLGKKERPILPFYESFLGNIQLHQPEQDFMPTRHQPLKQDTSGEFVPSQELLF
jgi:hypothetical protein